MERCLGLVRDLFNKWHTLGKETHCSTRIYLPANHGLVKKEEEKEHSYVEHDYDQHGKPRVPTHGQVGKISYGTREQWQNKHQMKHTIPLPRPSKIHTSIYTTLCYIPTKGPVPRPVAKAATRDPIRSPCITGNVQKKSEKISILSTYNVGLAYIFIQCFFQTNTFAK